MSLNHKMDSLSSAAALATELRTVCVNPEIRGTSVVANSNAMRCLLDLACRVARVDSTVLVTGESGSGKERIARIVNEASCRSKGAFIAINCGAIAETLLESELFGHARGAFSGAIQERLGLFEAAKGGTILLDEVGEISPAMQVKLLRVLQEREVKRVGENNVRPIDVRIVAATNRDLDHEVAQGTFRQDLYYRLKVVELKTPPLRDRADDIVPLACVLLAALCQRMKRDGLSLSPKATEQLLRYRWPGNVRELENAMERAVALAQGECVELADLPAEITQVQTKIAATGGATLPLEAVEKEYILATLAANGGNQAQTAQQLQIGTATLYRKLKSYGVLGATAARTRKQSGVSVIHRTEAACSEDAAAVARKQMDERELTNATILPLQRTYRSSTGR